MMTWIRSVAVVIGSRPGFDPGAGALSEGFAWSLIEAESLRRFPLPPEPAAPAAPGPPRRERGRRWRACDRDSGRLAGLRGEGGERRGRRRIGRLQTEPGQLALG